MGVGSVNPRASIPFNNGSSMPNASKLILNTFYKGKLIQREREANKTKS
jgi:hypothetical protein